MEINIKINKNYGDSTNSVILEDNGFYHCDPAFGKHIYKKGNKKFRLIEVNACSGFVYDITLQELE